MCAVGFFFGQMLVSLFSRMHSVFLIPKNKQSTFWWLFFFSLSWKCVWNTDHMHTTCTFFCLFINEKRWTVVYSVIHFPVFCVFDFSANNRHTRHELYIHFIWSALDNRVVVANVSHSKNWMGLKIKTLNHINCIVWMGNKNGKK